MNYIIKLYHDIIKKKYYLVRAIIGVSRVSREKKKVFDIIAFLDFRTQIKLHRRPSLVIASYPHI